jgi:hypothetical protein
MPERTLLVYTARVPLARQDIQPHSLPPPQGAPAGDPVERRLEAEGWIVCARCGGFVTESRARSSVNGAHEHTFINPAGVIFRVGCFSEAPGVRPAGEESSHWTWFAGFAWQVALCRSCAEHVGWNYRNADSRFVALIADRIVERRAPDNPSSPS